ncbi:MAG: phosphate signaling complex protein PhoU [Deltaproteobacteria bacterium]|nr:phosphate signaling complex protein PhoU [Candidatus Anaeroferrophillacea bacterium]
MTIHFLKEIEQLKKNLLALSALVERSVFLAVSALERRDHELVRQVIDADEEINRREVRIEEECLKIMALYQPVAIDLRFLVAVLKINSDFERIGDMAVNIAERARYFAARTDVEIPFDYAAMADRVKDMLRRSIDALVNLDTDAARGVCFTDEEVDEQNRGLYDQIKQAIKDSGGRKPARYLHMLSVAKNLERIADLATNIAEDVIYMVTGEIVRHKAAIYSEDLTE